MLPLIYILIGQKKQAANFSFSGCINIFFRVAKDKPQRNGNGDDVGRGWN